MEKIFCNNTCWVVDDFLFSSDALSMFTFNFDFRIYLDLGFASFSFDELRNIDIFSCSQMFSDFLKMFSGCSQDVFRMFS